MTSRAVRICFCQERARSWSEFSINFSQNTAWDLSREHWRDLINFESILFLSSLIVHLSETVKYLACPSKCGELSSFSRRLYFFLFQRKRCIFFQIPFWYFGIVQIWYITTAWKRGFGFWLYFYLSKRVSLCSRYGFFANLQLFCPIWSYRE